MNPVMYIYQFFSNISLGTSGVVKLTSDTLVWDRCEANENTGPISERC